MFPFSKGNFVESKYKKKKKQTNRRSYKGKNDKSLQSVKSAFSLCVSTMFKSSHLSLRRIRKHCIAMRPLFPEGPPESFL